MMVQKTPVVVEKAKKNCLQLGQVPNNFTFSP